ncbi:MAG: hypothetical protein WAN36_08590 [Calditrichia bacterium]
MNKIWTVYLFVIAFCVTLQAQDRGALVAPFEEGSTYLGFEVDRSPLISGGYFLRPQLALNGAFGLALNGQQNSNGFSLKFGLDSYTNSRKIAPFVGGYTRFDINPNAFGWTAWEGSRFLIGGHWGLHLQLMDELAVSGTIGGELQLNSPEQGDNSTNLVSFRSGLNLRYYFR